MKKIYFILFISVFLFSLNGEASDTDSFSLWVGNMNISIGMEKNKVINTLSENYEVTQDKIITENSTWENWSIYKKTKQRKAEDLIGSLAFQNGKVAWIGKSWGGFGGNEVASFGQEFVKALSKFPKMKEYNIINNITIYIHENNEPGISLKTIHLSSGKHDITIIVSDEGINMQENLSK
jgi:hypothetical protein